MEEKKLKFAINQIICENQKIDLQSFSCIKNEEIETQEITTSSKQKEVLSIKKVIKEEIEERFIAIYIEEGSKYPYASKVINTFNLQEEDNPRELNEIELNDQLFILIDIEKQRTYISDQRKKYSFNEWLSKKIGLELTIKALMTEDIFIEKLQTINEISFSIVPNLLNSTNEGSLGKELVRDIFGFGATSAYLKMQYEKNKIIDGPLFEKFKKLIYHKNDFQNITIVGRTDDKLESIFNMTEIVNKISISIEPDIETKKLDKDKVFIYLIEKIKENEK